MPSEAFAEESQEDDAASSTSGSTSRAGDEEDEDFMPAEVYAQEYRAKKKINELKQMRQFFKGGNTEKTKQWVKEQQKKEPCFLCQKLGHWSRECPERASKKQGKPTRSVHVTAGNVLPEPGQWDLLASMAAYKEPDCARVEVPVVRDCFVEQGPHVNPVVDHETFWSLRELHSSLILDLGCMKSVAGAKWVNQHIQRLKSEGRWMKAEKEKESFRFGDGHELWSQYAFIFEATILGVRVIIRLSVVPGECPPLLSKPACTQLGMVIDTEHHTVSSRKLKVTNYGLAQTFGGHYALPIAEFDPQSPPLHDPEVPSHVEAIPVYASESLDSRAVLESFETSKGQANRSEGSLGLWTWTRQDKKVPCALGTGRNGPAWEAVIRRTVYDSSAGAKLLDEEVTGDTVIRQPFGNVHDTTTILMYRGSGPTSRLTSVPDPMCKGTAAQLNLHNGPVPSTRGVRPDLRTGRRNSGFVRLEQSGSGDRRGGGQGQTDSVQAEPASILRGHRQREEIEVQVSGQGAGEEAQREGCPPEVEATGGREEADALRVRRGDQYGFRAREPKGSLEASRILRGEGRLPGGHDCQGEEDDQGVRQQPGDRVCPTSNEGVLCGSERSPSPDRRDRSRPEEFHNLKGAGQAEEGWRGKLQGPGEVVKGQGRDLRGHGGGSGTAQREPKRPRVATRSGAGSPNEGEDEEAFQSCAEAADGCGSPLPVPLQQVLGRPGGQYGDHLPVDAVHMEVEGGDLDAPNPPGNQGRVRSQGQMEAKSEVAHGATGQADRLHVGSSRLPAADHEQPQAPVPDDGRHSNLGGAGGGRAQATKRPSRGLMQKLRSGVGTALTTMSLLTLAASCAPSWTAMEVFARKGDWADMLHWKVEGPSRGSRGPLDMRTSRRLLEQAKRETPDVIILAPPTGPWTTWSARPPAADLNAKAAYYPTWWLIYKLWELQNERGGLILLQHPAKMKPPGPDDMRDLQRVYEGAVAQENAPDWLDRDRVYRGGVDMCQMNLVDPDSGLPIKMSTGIEVNDPYWCACLEAKARCRHAGQRHQAVEGVLQSGEPRMDWVARWTPAWSKRILITAQEALENKRRNANEVPLHAPCPETGQWETVPVEVEQSPEGLLRQRLGEVTGQRFDYIYFEGASGSLSRQLRSTLAKLHVMLGHVTNTKLKRMLYLNGAKDHILNAVTDLRCQICQTVMLPTPAPKVSFDKPQRFNERILSDVFFVWDSAGEKYAVAHLVDAFSLCMIAQGGVSPRADWISTVMKQRWIGVFGPPECLMTDAGNEYASEVETMARSYNIFHDIVPPTAKWRMGLAERHGAVLKLLIMKTIVEVTAKGFREVSECVLSAVAARNRQVRVGGFSPTQIVLGKDVAISSSLLEQLEKGHFKYVINQDLSFDAARRRSEQIRQAAEAAFLWADSNETLRKALNSKSRAPRMEMIYEGAQVYFWDPPPGRKGLPKRLQDQTSWTGPAVVVALERRGGAVKRVWVRYRTKLRGVPLEYVRLAALEEVESSKVCAEALKEVEKELNGGWPEVEEMLDDGQVPDDEPLLEFPKDEDGLEAKPDEKAVASSLDDLPAQLHREKRDGGTGMSPTPPKKLRFEEAKEKTAEHLKHMKEVMEKYEPRTLRQNEQQGGATSSAAPPPNMSQPSPPQQASRRGHGVLHSSRVVHGVLHVQRVYHLDNATRSQRKMLLAAKRNGWSTYVAEVLDVTTDVETAVKGESQTTPNLAEDLVTGKPRLEFRWKELDEDWKSAFENPLKKAIDVYVDNLALRPVPEGKVVPPTKVLPSRFVLTNKGGTTLEEAELKARWVLAGHLDKEAGQHATEAPTASLISHNVICFLSAQLKWKMRYADISAAFLQGEFLDETREVYVKFPRGYPDGVGAHLRARLAGLAKGTMRDDIVQLMKGGFGLAESPRLWYLRLKRGLESLGLKELRLAPGTFTYHVRGKFRGVLAIHVDDIRMAFHPMFEDILEKLKELFRFGEWQDALSKKVKFCGRWESQDPETFRITITMDGYAPKLRDPPQREGQDRAPLTDVLSGRPAQLDGQAGES